MSNQDNNYMEQSSETETKQLQFGSTLDNQVIGEDDSPIEIYVIDPIKKDGIKSYIVYTIRGKDKDGTFEITRRYSDFDQIRETLVKRWPGCYIPPLPPKQIVGNKDNEFIEDRRKQLEQFCQRIANLRYLFYSEEFRLFLRNSSQDLEKVLAGVSKQSYEDLIQKYHINFKALHQKEINTDLVLKISTFIQYLKKIKVMLENFREMAKNCGKARRDYNDQFNIFLVHLVPEYEKNCLQEYSNGAVEKNVFNGWENDPELLKRVQAFKESNNEHNSFDHIQDLVGQEIHEVSSFQDAINMKNHYENLKEKAQQKQKELALELQSVLVGKTTMKSLFSKGSKEDNKAVLEKNIQNNQKEVDALIHICDIITVILGYIEIDRFKNEKTEQYYSLIKRMSQLEIEYASYTTNLWNSIASNQNVLEAEMKL